MIDLEFLAFVLTCCLASSCVLGVFVFGVTARMAWHEIAAIRIVNGILENIVMVQVLNENYLAWLICWVWIVVRR